MIVKRSKKKKTNSYIYHDRHVVIEERRLNEQL